MNEINNLFNNLIIDDKNYIKQLYINNFNKEIEIVNNELNTNNTPLHIMAKYGLYELAKYYIESNSICIEMMNVKDDNNMTPIDYAARYGNIDILKLLLVGSFHSALKYSVYYKRYNIVFELLKFQIPFIEIEQALYIAYNNQDKLIINLLINYIDG